MNWVLIIVVAILAVALIVFLVIRNQKDKKKFTDQLNNDYPKRDTEIDELTDSVH